MRARRPCRARREVSVAGALAIVACGAALAGGALTACGAPALERGARGVTLVRVAHGLRTPVHVAAPAGDPRLFVVEKTGAVRILAGGRMLDPPFLDLRGQVGREMEQGLLGIAFHPRYHANGTFFVNYTDRRGDTRVVRYRVSADSNRADPTTATQVLAVDQPYANHNGGHLLFGPDGMLYVPLGDGGAGGDPHRNGQNLGTLLGKLLRIDVDADTPYAVPRDNPFVDRPGARPEIWAYGLRNPWRVAFDPEGQWLYIADVGQNQWEEIHVAPAGRAGLDYGWNLFEGTHCYPRGPCDPTGREMPVVEYEHGEGCSITGGHVYRGRRVPALAGHYLFSDYCTGFLRSFRWRDGRVEAYHEWRIPRPGSVTSFGEDGAGELYVCTAEGNVYRIEAAGAR